MGSSVVIIPSLVQHTPFLPKLIFFLAWKIVLVFLILILIRVTTPRMKIESFNKIGWLVIISVTILTTILVFAVYSI